MGRRSRVLVACGGVLVGLLGVVGCGTADAEGAPVERKSFDLEGSALTVDSDHSRLVITPADIDEVRVERQVDGWVFMGSGPEASWKLVDGRLTLRVECDAVASNCAAVHRIQVPRKVAVAVESDNGDVTAEGLATPLKVRTDNGDVRVRKAGAALDLGSTNGDVVVDAGTTSADLAVRTDNGDVRLALGAVPRNVEIATDNGDVTAELPKAEYAVAGSSGNGDVRIDVPRRDGSGNAVRARSENGDVTVRTVN
ncbi:DUF4097 domain-containing protein [Streptomyces cinereoruber subsp. cinereoruber]|nr:DUF4097 domain-containing protein [Streptomyces cinereoruber]